MRWILTCVLTMLIYAMPAHAQRPMDTATQREVTIAGGDITLGATLYRPANARGNLPAVVIAHGSAPTTRTQVGFYINLALRMGFAVLSFDKRGTGQSTGVYEEFNVADSDRQFRALASDVVHSVRWLAEQRGIDVNRIGLLGGSQAGWIMPLAAQQEPRVRFIIAGAGVPLTAGQEAIHEAYIQAVISEETGLSWPQLWAADTVAVQYQGPPGYDPAPVLEAINTPTLWIFGLYDIAIPTMPSIDRVGELIRAGKTNNAVHVLPYADHNFTNEYTQTRYDLVTVMEPWLRTQGVLR